MMSQYDKQFRVACNNFDIEEIKQLTNELTFNTTVQSLMQKERLSLLGKQRDPKKVIELFSWLKEKNSIENYKNQGKIDKFWLGGMIPVPYFAKNTSQFIPASKKSIDLFYKSKNKMIDTLKNSLFADFVENINKDDERVFDLLDTVWTHKKNLNHLAKRCGQQQWTKIAHKIILEMKQANEATNPQFKDINPHYFFKNLISHSASTAYLDHLWLNYEKEIKETFQFLIKKKQFWLSANEQYHYGIQNVVIENFNYEKFKWFEDKKIGLKQVNYKCLDLFLSVMTSDQTQDYIKTNDKIIFPLIKEYLKNPPAEWTRKKYYDGDLKGMTISQGLSKAISWVNFEKLLPEKCENNLKKMKI